MLIRKKEENTSIYTETYRKRERERERERT
jgi:hypothetical protein